MPPPIFFYLLAVGVAAMPDGPSEVCNSNKNTTCNTDGDIDAESYIWLLNPAKAGVITGSSTSCIVNCSTDYSGIAEVLGTQ
jgi:hypothetical protein